MSKKHRQAERKHDKDAELAGATPDLETSDSRTPMQRFETLASALMKVPPEALKEELDRVGKSRR